VKLKIIPEILVGSEAPAPYIQEGHVPTHFWVWRVHGGHRAGATANAQW